jgi:hypothetical protein
VRTAVDQLFKDFNARNVTGLVSFYAFSAEIIWTGNTQGLYGGYTGAGAIAILYGSTIGKTTNLNATFSNYAEKAVTPSNVNVTLTLALDGNSTVLGRLNGIIDVSQKWIYTQGEWQIVKENWNYKTFQIQYPVSATTFPQWGVMKGGKSPDLVSEKNLEWQAGPYLAAGVYAFLFSVLALAVMKHRTVKSRQRSSPLNNVLKEEECDRCLRRVS